MSLTFADEGKLAREIADRAAKPRTPLVITGGPARTRLLLDVASQLDNPIVVRVPRQLDRVQHVILSIAAQCGRKALRDVDRALVPQSGRNVLNVLARAVGKRPLLVDDLHMMSSSVSDPELFEIVAHQTNELRTWLTTNARVSTFAKPQEQGTYTVPESQPPAGAQLLWDRVGRDPDRFTLAWMRQQLTEVSLADTAWDAESLVRDVWSVLSSPLRALIVALVVHGRPVGREQLLALGLHDARVLDHAIERGIVEHRQHQDVWLARPWYRHCPDLGIPERRSEEHRRLGSAFASLARQDASDADPTTVLEAYRHLCEAGDVEEALEFARFGAVLLLETARERSLAKDWPRAIRTYEMVLTLEGLDKRTVAYATHYRAYNRYKANQYPIADTLREYEKSVEKWPEHALFWSRLVSGLFIAGRRRDALERLDRALRPSTGVPEHPNRIPTLIGRTTEKLLQHDLVQDAALAWGDTNRTKRLEDCALDLEPKLAAGFDDDHFYGEPDLVLYEPRRVRVTPVGGAWAASGLEKTAHGPTPRAAIEAWSLAVRDEAEHLLCALTHTLEPEERLRKRVLLGAVNVLASQIGPKAEDLWVAGQLEREGEDVVLVTSDGERYPLAPALRSEIDVSAPYRVGRIALDAYQQPHGDILELEPAKKVDPAAVWAEWKRRVDEG